MTEKKVAVLVNINQEEAGDITYGELAVAVVGDLGKHRYIIVLYC